MTESINSGKKRKDPIKSDQLLSGVGHGSKLGVKGESFVVALMSEKSVAAAARNVGISEPTAYRYMKNPKFRSLLQQRRNEAFTQSVARMDSLYADALDTLGHVVNSAEEDSRCRISAAAQIIRLTLLARGTFDLSDRVAVLEAEREDDE